MAGAQGLFLKVEGIEGLTMQDSWKGWHAIQQMSTGIANGVDSHGGEHMVSTGGATASEVSLSLKQDKQTPMFFQFCQQGKPIGTIEINHASGAEKKDKQLQWKFTDCIFTNVSLSGQDDGDSFVTVSFAYAGVNMDASKVDYKTRKVEAGAKWTFDFVAVK